MSAEADNVGQPPPQSEPEVNDGDEDDWEALLDAPLELPPPKPQSAEHSAEPLLTSSYTAPAPAKLPEMRPQTNPITSRDPVKDVSHVVVVYDCRLPRDELTSRAHAGLTRPLPVVLEAEYDGSMYAVVFSDAGQAGRFRQQALHDGDFHVRSYNPPEREFAHVRPSELRPPRERPTTTTATANRLLGAALNLKLGSQRDKEDTAQLREMRSAQQRRRQQEAEEARRADAWRQSVWDG